MSGSAAIIGAGLIGRAWAIVFARAGWSVNVFDPDRTTREALNEALHKDCELLVKFGLCDDVKAVLARISTSDTMTHAVKDADFVQENGPERADAKQEIFSALDRFSKPDTILASSTSAIVASLWAKDLRGRARCLVGHPVNPPHLVPLVEVCGASFTSDETIKRAMKVYAEVGQVPVHIRRETDGFVLNRLQGALLAEAFRLVRDRVISIDDLDKTMRDGLGLRWSFMGPFETIDLNAPGGIRDYCDRYTGFYKRLMEDPPGAEVFSPESVDTMLVGWRADAVPERLSKASNLRNERLAALRGHKLKHPNTETSK